MGRNDHLVHLENGRLAEDTGPAHVRDLARRALESNSPNGLVIHFHGGLVSHTTGLEIVDRLRHRYTRAKAFLIFLLWESGFFETLTNNFREILKDLGSGSYSA